MTPANRVPATMAPVTAPPTVPNWEALLLDRAPLVLVFAVCVSIFSRQIATCSYNLFHITNFLNVNTYLRNIFVYNFLMLAFLFQIAMISFKFCHLTPKYSSV